MALCLVFHNSRWHMGFGRELQHGASSALPPTVAWPEQLEPFGRSTVWPSICLNVYLEMLLYSHTLPMKRCLNLCPNAIYLQATLFDMP